MSNHRLILYISLLGSLILGSVTLAHAQETTGGFAGSFSRMGFSPRGMAMGNAMTSVIQEGSYSYYNPAFAAIKTEGIQIDAGTSSLQFDRQLNMFQSHFRLPPSAGLSVSLLHGRVGNIDGRNLDGYHTEFLSTNEFQLTGNFGLRFSPAFWGGIGLKYNLARYHPELQTTSGIGIDFGILVNPLPQLRFGFTVRDLLAAYRFNTTDLYATDSSNNQQHFPIRVSAGVSYEVSDQWLVSLDLERRRNSFEKIQDTNMNPSTAMRNDSGSINNFIKAGSRYNLHERFTFRLGIQLYDVGNENEIQPSTGFSIHLPYDTFSPSIDYAFVREPSGLSTMHVFAIRLKL